jgi:hypothetical protein
MLPSCGPGESGLFRNWPRLSWDGR